MGWLSALNPFRETDAAKAIRVLESRLEKLTKESITPVPSPFIPAHEYFDDWPGERYAYPRGYPQDKKHGENWPVIRHEDDLRLARATSRLLAETNPLCIGFLSHVTNFVVGPGFKWHVGLKGMKGDKDSKDPAVVQAQRFLDDFRALNGWGDTGEVSVGDGTDDDDSPSTDLEAEAFTSAMSDGEFFLRMFPGDSRTNGVPLVRRVNPECVRVPLGENHQGPWSFGIETDPEDRQRRLRYYVADPDAYPEGGEIVPAGEMIHLKLNAASDVKRGVPDLWPLEHEARHLRKLWQNMSEVSAILSAIAYIRQHAAGVTGTQITNLLDRTKSGTDTRGIRNYDQYLGEDVYRSYTRMEGGTVIDVTNGQEWVPPPIAAGIPGFTQAMQATLRIFGLRWGCPEYFSGDASNANFASTLVAGGPFERATQRRQRQFRIFQGNLASRVLLFGVRAGRLRREDVQRLSIAIDPPAVAIANKTEDTQRRATLNQAGVLSVRTWAAEEGLDPEAEAAQVKAEEAAQQPPPGMGGGGDPGAPVPGGGQPPDAGGGMDLATLLGESVGPPPWEGAVFDRLSHRWKNPDGGEGGSQQAQPAQPQSPATASPMGPARARQIIEDGGDGSDRPTPVFGDSDGPDGWDQTAMEFAAAGRASAALMVAAVATLGGDIAKPVAKLVAKAEKKTASILNKARAIHPEMDAADTARNAAADALQEHEQGQDDSRPPAPDEYDPADDPDAPDAYDPDGDDPADEAAMTRARAEYVAAKVAELEAAYPQQLEAWKEGYRTRRAELRKAVNDADRVYQRYSARVESLLGSVDEVWSDFESEVYELANNAIGPKAESVITEDMPDGYLADGDPDTTEGIRALMDDPDALGEIVRESVEPPPADDVTDAGLVSMAMLKAKLTGDDDLIDQLAALGDDPDGLQSLLDELAIAATPKEEAEGPGRTPPRPGLVWKDATKRWVRDPEAGSSKKAKGGADAGTPKAPTKAQAAKAQKAANMATAKDAVTAALADPSSVQPEQLGQLASHLKTMTIAELKGHLKGVKGKVSGTKVQLVDRLIEHVKGGGGSKPTTGKPDLTVVSDDDLRAEYERRFGGAKAQPADQPPPAAEQPKAGPKKAEPAELPEAAKAVVAGIEKHIADWKPGGKWSDEFAAARANSPLASGKTSGAGSAAATEVARRAETEANELLSRLDSAGLSGDQWKALALQVTGVRHGTQKKARLALMGKMTAASRILQGQFS